MCRSWMKVYWLHNFKFSQFAIFIFSFLNSQFVNAALQTCDEADPKLSLNGPTDC